MAGEKSRQRAYTELPSQSVSFDVEAFNENVRAQGVKLLHYKAMRCPVGMITAGDDNRRPHEDHAGCSNGFLYHEAGTITAMFTANSNSMRMNDVGYTDGSSVSVTFPSTYDNQETPFYVAPFDRFYLAESNIAVPTWQTFQCHQSGMDRTRFPIEEVEYLMDSFGRTYQYGTDFDVSNGQIKWLTANRPGIDMDTGKGIICSVRYLYRPFWYCARMLHEVRIHQTEEGLFRMPQSAVLNREYLYLNEEQDDTVKEADSLRQMPAPDDGGWGSSR
jgi:hypothetical protein